MKASELKTGMVIQVEGRNVLVRDVQVQTAASRSGNTLYKLRGRDVVSKQKVDRAFKGDEVLQPVDFERRPVSFLFQDPEGCTFMDAETYEQYVFGLDDLAEELPYLTEGIEGVQALVADGQVLGIELPATVVLEIVETAPGV